MEVVEGEAYSRQAFESYFFAADVIVAVRVDREGSGGDEGLGGHVDRRDGFEIVSGRSGLPDDGQSLVWEDVIIGFYYVGDSFPVHSSPDNGWLTIYDPPLTGKT